MSYNRSYNEPRGTAPTESLPPHTGVQGTASRSSGTQPMQDPSGYDRGMDHPASGLGTRGPAATGPTQGYDARMGEPGATGLGATGPGVTGTQQSTIPPTGAQNQYQTRGGPGGTGQKMVGKLESAMGAVTGSEQLKAEGMQKEREANAMKVQGRELAEAERLEQEARTRRQRAVEHGAHPDHGNLRSGKGGNARDSFLPLS